MGEMSSESPDAVTSSQSAGNVSLSESTKERVNKRFFGPLAQHAGPGERREGTGATAGSLEGCRIIQERGAIVSRRPGVRSYRRVRLRTADQSKTAPQVCAALRAAIADRAGGVAGGIRLLGFRGNDRRRDRSRASHLRGRVGLPLARHGGRVERLLRSTRSDSRGPGVRLALLQPLEGAQERVALLSGSCRRERGGKI